MLITVDSQTATRLLRIYGINPPVMDERFGLDADAGISVTIDGVVDQERGPSIRLKIAGRRSLRACPVTEYEAERLVAEFHSEDLLAPDPKADRTLVHLVTKCSKLYAEAGVNELHLVLYITPLGYRTHAVYMLRTRNIVAKRPFGAKTPEGQFQWRRPARSVRGRKRS
jgi:hypothetical protein